MSGGTIIWGTGREARAAAALLGTPVIFADDVAQGPDEIDGHKVVRGDIAALLQNADVIVKSPGISLYDPRIAGKNVTSLMNLWFERKPASAKTICISGTKGKSTTSTLLYHVLNALGLNAVLSGNIGAPLNADAFHADIVIIEVSSYQAANFSGLCDIGVVTNLYEEHLDWHGSRAQYFADKLNLLNNAKVKLIGEQALEASHYHGASVIPHAPALPDNPYLRRAHNAANVAAVLAVTRELGIQDANALAVMVDFKGLAHRQYELGEQNGILYVDDSIATTPQSTGAAMDVYAARPITLIAGGFDRGIDYAPLLQAVKNHTTSAVICLGDSGKRICDLLQQNGFVNAYNAADMAQAVALAKAHTQTGGVILLSPAAPSYGLFTDFTERGRAFAKEAGF